MQRLQMLLIENSKCNAECIQNELHKAGLQPEIQLVTTRYDAETALSSRKWDIILSNHNVSDFNSFEALGFLKNTSNCTPLLIVSDKIGEETAVNLVLKGASGYISYSNLDRLVPEIDRVLKERGLSPSEKNPSDSDTIFRKLAELTPSVVFILQDGRYIYVNKTFQQKTGYTEEEALSMDYLQVIHPDFRKLVAERYISRLMNDTVPPYYEIKVVAKDGTEYWAEYIATLFEYQGKPALLGTVYDITDMKEAREMMRIQGELAITLSYISDLNEALELILEATLQTGCIDCGAIYLTNDHSGSIDLVVHRGLSKAFINSCSHYDSHTPQIELIKSGRPIYTNAADNSIVLSEVIKSEGLRAIAIIPVLHEGRTVAVMCLASHKIKEIPIFASNVFESIALKIGNVIERVKVETEMRESKENFQNLYNMVEDLLLIFDKKGNILHTNPSVRKHLGYSENELLKMNILDFHRPEGEDAGEVVSAILSGKVYTCTVPLIARNKTIIEVETRVTRGKWNGKDVLFGISRDISERKRTENVNEAISKMYKPLIDPSYKINGISKVVIEQAKVLTKSKDGYLGSISPHDNNFTKTTQNNMHGICRIAGEDKEMTLVRGEDGRYPYLWGHTLNTLKGFYTNNLKNHILPTGIIEPVNNFLSVPILIGSELVGQITLTNSERDYNDKDLAATTRLSEYYALAIQRKRYVDELKTSYEQVRNTMEGAIHALATVSEVRDPYTAGHQRRVASLAAAIARNMNLPEEQIEGINMSAIVHDIGKIYLPAEILSKPGQLSGIEFDLVKTHAHIGYEVLKTIDFPWPVANIVLQHHERLNGSGYPNGLDADEILIEAKILCVADVVEAMSSHRPYRPALGIEKALDEISTNKGILYDPDVVDNCIHVVTDGKFGFM